MAQYEPAPPARVESVDELFSYLVRELREIARMSEGVEAVILPTLHVQPSKRVVGMLALADGSDWNPGSGAGVYRWNGAAWAFLG